MSRLSLNRRRFLTASAASVALAALPSTARATAGESLQLGIQLYSLRGYSRDEALRHAKSLGFQQVEFYGGMFPTDAATEQIAEVKQQVADLGLSISAHGVNRFGTDADANRKIFEFASAVGIPTITADPHPDSFDNLDELVDEFDIRIAIHNHGPRHRYNKVVDVLNAIERHDRRIGACADLGHYIRSGEQPVDVIRALKGRLYGVHLKDFAEMKDRAEGVILGEGHLDLEGVFFAMKEAEFPADGALSLEYEENPNDPLDDIRQCVAVAQAAIKKVDA